MARAAARRVETDDHVDALQPLPEMALAEAEPAASGNSPAAPVLPVPPPDQPPPPDKMPPPPQPPPPPEPPPQKAVQAWEHWHPLPEQPVAITLVPYDGRRVVVTDDLEKPGLEAIYRKTRRRVGWSWIEYGKWCSPITSVPLAFEPLFWRPLNPAGEPL